jgi:hypothetical protein
VRGSVLCLAIASMAVLVVPATSHGKPSRGALSPELFHDVSTGIAYITTFSCSGRKLGTGSGFLVGESVVMTARHVLRGSCRARVKVDGERFRGVRWVYWGTGGSSGNLEDLATLKLDRPAYGHVFRFRTSPPRAGANLAMIGYPLGNRISLNQGKVLRRVRIGRVPLIAVRMLGAEGASGSPFVDDSGRVIGLLQIGLGSKDLLGQRTSGLLLGIDLSIWWGSRVRGDLCRAYPLGGIAGCTGGGGTGPPPPPTTTPPPPPSPAPPTISACWVTASDSWDPGAKAFSLSPASQTIYLVAQFTRPATFADRMAIAAQVFRPDGTVFSQGAWDESGKTFPAYRVRYDLRGRNASAPIAGMWRASMTLNGAGPCVYTIPVDQRASPVDISPNVTEFDPYFAYSISVPWKLIQDVPPSANIQLRLITPSGSTADTELLFISDYSTSGTAFLSLPFCSRFLTTDTCQYGAYRIEVLSSGSLVASTSLTGKKP